MSRIRVLTGITTTGTPHLGNYVGAIRPAVRASRDPQVDAFYFLADYHALIKCDDPLRIARSRLEIAATWLAAGLDPAQVCFYRQSDIPEIPELTWLLTCVTGKGLMNRAHAYKAATDANEAAGEDADAGVTMGLFSYPVLMAADILMFNAHRVPVGRDQVQHIEMARDIAARFNHLFGEGTSLFVLPEAQIEASVATLPGLDGRKMSKSYDNTIPLFQGGSKALREAIFKIVTDSRLPGEPKDPDSSALMVIFEAFASADESARLRSALREGLGWGEAKQWVFDSIDRELAPMRARYEELIAQPQHLEAVLIEGAAKARRAATPFLVALREAVGLRRFDAHPVVDAAPVVSKQALPEFKQFRESVGSFRFKLLDGQGVVLLQSVAFESPRLIGQLIANWRTNGQVSADELQRVDPSADHSAVSDALQRLLASAGE